MSSPVELLGGTVTFVFTDIEGSTRLLKRLGDGYGDVLAQHQSVIRAAFERHRGQEFGTEGNALFFAFRRARDAIAAAVGGQLGLAGERWPGGVEVVCGWDCIPASRAWSMAAMSGWCYTGRRASPRRPTAARSCCDPQRQAGRGACPDRRV